MEIDLFEEIARTVDNNTNKTIDSAIDGLGLTLGIITSTGLALDNFKHEINDYLILDHLKLKESYAKNKLIREESHSHDISNSPCSVETHSHDFIPPKELERLKIGNRVLVAQLGADFIVIGRISNA